MLAAALAYAARGWPVFPLAVRGKVPLLSTERGGRGARDATTDPHRIGAWWSRVPGANVGIATGDPFGLVVDIDASKGGADTMRALTSEHGRLAATLVSRTGNGWHYVYRLPASPVRMGVNVLGPGVDTRTTGGYVVAPPSIHPNGKRYVWLSDLEPAPCPAWVAQLAAPLPAPAPRPILPGRAGVGVVDRARAWLAMVDPSIQGQHGSARAWHAALGLVRGFMLDTETALALLMSDAFNARCDPPWSERELRQKVACADRASVALGYLLNVPRRNPTP